MKLNHPFANSLPSVEELFLNSPTEPICTIDHFCRRVEQLADKYSNVRDPNDFKGDALELLVEYMIKVDGSDNRIGIYDYRSISETGNDDFGVDGVGIGENGKPATVQVKFRTGQWVLRANEDSLSNYLTSSIFDFHVEVGDKNNMLIVTTGLKVDESTMQNMLKGVVRVLNREALKQMYDNRKEWWSRLYESVRDSRTEKAPAKLVPLRNHQSEAVAAAIGDSNQKGMVFLPTGVGKTYIEAYIVCQKILEYRAKGNLSPVILVNSSRILLCFQLFDEFLGVIRGHGIEAGYVNFNSGDKDESEYINAMRQEGWAYRTIESTTSPVTVFNSYIKCRNAGIPLVIFSTYNSAERLAMSGVDLNVIVNDEAHNLVSEAFCRVAKMKADCTFFFTATKKECGYEGGIGMDNEQIFDKIIYQKSAKEMIEAGEMIAPYLHIVRSSNNATMDTDYTKMFVSIVEAYGKHEEKIKSTSSNPAEIGAKVLVVCRGQIDLIEMFKLREFEAYRLANPDIHFFGLSSDFGIYCDGVFEPSPVTNTKKHKLLKKLKALGHAERAVIFHVDMIGEGIDVPGITGVMPFRNCELVKLVQNVGRACRLHLLDRTAFYNGEISPAEKTKGWIKPYSWVIVPSYMQDTEGMEFRIKDIVTSLREEFGWVPTQIDLVENANGIDDPVYIPPVNAVTKTKQALRSGIDTFLHEYEELTPVERVILNEDAEEQKRAILSRWTKPQPVEFVESTASPDSTTKVSDSDKVRSILLKYGCDDIDSIAKMLGQ